MFAIGRCELRVLSRVLSRGAVAGAVQGAPDHVCHGAVQRCCRGCSGSRLLLGGVRVLLRVLSRVLRIMFAIGWFQGALQGAPDHVCHWAVSHCCPKCCVGVRQGASDHVCHVRVLSRVVSWVLSRALSS